MKSCGSGPCHDSKWLDSSAHHVLTQYIRIMKLHRSILEQRLNKTGVYRSQHQILTTLAERVPEGNRGIFKRHRGNHSGVGEKTGKGRLYHENCGPGRQPVQQALSDRGRARCRGTQPAVF